MRGGPADSPTGIGYDGRAAMQPSDSPPSAALFPAWRGLAPIIGMVHLRALPGAPANTATLDEIEASARTDARALVTGGAHGVLVENFGDAPFFPGRVPAATLAAMTRVARSLRELVDLPLGVNVLRNDGCGALAIAHAVGADFIRVNVLTGTRLTDQRIIQGIAHDLLRLSKELGADSIKILADVNVKHSAALADYGVEQEVEDAVHRDGADAVIVSGSGTGKRIDTGELRNVQLADGFIVGTGLKKGGDVDRPIDPDRVRDLAGALEKG